LKRKEEIWKGMKREYTKSIARERGREREIEKERD
jgi:hypothetical protein